MPMMRPLLPNGRAGCSRGHSSGCCRCESVMARASRPAIVLAGCQGDHATFRRLTREARGEACGGRAPVVQMRPIGRPSASAPGLTAGAQLPRAGEVDRLAEDTSGLLRGVEAGRVLGLDEVEIELRLALE